MQKIAAQIGADDEIKMLRRKLVQRCSSIRRAHIVERKVESAIARRDFLEHAFNLRFIAHIGDDKLCRAAGRYNVSRHGVALGLAPATKNHLRAGRGERLGGDRAHSRRGTGDQSNLARKPFGCRSGSASSVRIRRRGNFAQTGRAARYRGELQHIAARDFIVSHAGEFTRVVRIAIDHQRIFWWHDLVPFYDEMRSDAEHCREHYQPYARWLAEQSASRLEQKRAEADALFHRLGITFAVYGEEEGSERLIPFDIVPRILPAHEWQQLEAGLKQRARALNLFVDDVYHDQRILKAGAVPIEAIVCNAQYRPEMQGIDVPGGIYAHIAGIDIVRAGAGEFYVLEDNLRVPSGVSYMLEDRRMMMRLFPELFSRYTVAPVEHYPEMLLENLQSVAPSGVAEPNVVVLTPGAFNSAYFEHAFLAQQMGIELVEGQDLFVRDDFVFMRTTRGPQRVDVIYRRIDDDFLDPLAFRSESTLGVPGLLAAYRAGHVTVANAIGTGIADDKSVYPYVPDMIRFYLSEEPILNNVPTRVLRRPDDLAYTLAHLEELVVKEVHGAGGYGMLIGPAASRAEIEEFRTRIKANPERYIAQPTLALSACPTFVESGLAPRHIDLRPFVLSGRDVRVVPGGLTRVALREGSLVVNSSQGGGTKDTWVLQT